MFQSLSISSHLHQPFIKLIVAKDFFKCLWIMCKLLSQVRIQVLFKNNNSHENGGYTFKGVRVASWQSARQCWHITDKLNGHGLFYYPDTGEKKASWIIWTPNFGREDWGLTNPLFSTDDNSSLHTSPACTWVPSSYLKPGEMNTVLGLWEPWVTTSYRLHLWGQRKPSAPRTTCFCFGEWCLRWLAWASQLSNTLIQKATSDPVSSWPVSF